jgi:phosphate-selective porin OprO and OprP
VRAVASLVLFVWVAAPAGAFAAAASSPGDAPPGGDSLGQLRQELDAERQQLRQQEARILALEERLAANADPAQRPDASGLRARFGADGYTLESADGANAIHIRGNVSFDGRYYGDSNTPATADTWLIRRLRPTLEGRLGEHFDFRFMPDFAQGRTILQDAWGDVRVRPWLVLQFGKFKAPVGLERLQLEQFARFIEVSLPSDLLPYRDLGLKLGGTIGRGFLTYDVGLFDGALDGGSTDGNSVPDQNSTGKFTWEGRLFGRPFLETGPGWARGLGLGLAGTYVNVRGVATPATATAPASTTTLLASYKTPGQQPMFAYRGNSGTGGLNNATIAAGLQRRLVPQLYYYYRSWSLMGEYVGEDQAVSRSVSPLGARSATLHHTAWQIEGAWFLTGEDEAYDRATPARSFGFGRGGPGAWELVARYHEIRFDARAFSAGAQSFANPQTAPLAAHAIGTGINWYLNPGFKVQLDYEVTRFEGGALTGDRPDERVLLSQFALIF